MGPCYHQPGYLQRRCCLGHHAIHGAMLAIGYALFILLFAMSLFKNTANFHELKRPEAALHYLIRFVAAKTAVGYGMEIMLKVFEVCNGIVSEMADSMGGISQAMVSLPGEVQTAIENVGFLASIPLWLVTILGSLFVTVLSFIMILTVYHHSQQNGRYAGHGLPLHAGSVRYSAPAAFRRDVSHAGSFVRFGPWCWHRHPARRGRNAALAFAGTYHADHALRGSGRLRQSRPSRY